MCQILETALWGLVQKFADEAKALALLQKSMRWKGTKQALHLLATLSQYCIFCVSASGHLHHINNQRRLHITQDERL